MSQAGVRVERVSSLYQVALLIAVLAFTLLPESCGPRGQNRVTPGAWRAMYGGTEPAYVEDQPRFLNAAVLAYTDNNPQYVESATE
eukprot:scaffold55_cov401-Prasinococcus_capsulatus_cf.AAC.6